jgi:hypothetical protein
MEYVFGLIGVIIGYVIGMACMYWLMKDLNRPKRIEQYPHLSPIPPKPKKK